MLHTVRDAGENRRVPEYPFPETSAGIQSSRRHMSSVMIVLFCHDSGYTGRTRDSCPHRYGVAYPVRCQTDTGQVTGRHRNGLLWRDPGKRCDLSKASQMVSSDGAAFTIKNPFGNSDTSEPDTNPVVPLFPGPPEFRGHNMEKCGNGPESSDDLRRERMRSYRAMLQRPKTGKDVVWDAVSTCRGIRLPPSLERKGKRRILPSKKLTRAENAGSRIRTDELLREQILSLSPLAGLGYPRACVGLCWNGGINKVTDQRYLT
jgi:hypothetical protein